MTPTPDPNQMWHAGMSFWAQLWQRQMEQSLQFWSAWAQMLPHESARELADEAEAMKAPSKARKPAARKPRAKAAAAG